MSVPFAVLAALLLTAAAAAVLAPLLRRRRGPTGPDAARLRADAHRRRLAELAAEHEAGLLTEADLAAAREEEERALARELDAGLAPGAARGWAPAAAVVAVALAVGVGSYLWLGRPDLADPALDPRALAGRASPPSVEAMVARLEARLRSRPDDAEGWMMLGRSYRVLGRAREAARAYGEALRRVPEPTADLLVAFAEARILAAEGEVDAEAARALTRALGKEPDHPLGLWLDGVAALQRGDPARAIARWERVLATGGAESAEVEALLREQIAAARRRLAASRPGSTSGPPAQGEAEQKE